MGSASKGRGIYVRDYSNTLETITILKIRADLMKCPQLNYATSWESKRLRRLNQILKNRNELPTI